MKKGKGVLKINALWLIPIKILGCLILAAKDMMMNELDFSWSTFTDVLKEGTMPQIQKKTHFIFCSSLYIFLGNMAIHSEFIEGKVDSEGEGKRKWIMFSIIWMKGYHFTKVGEITDPAIIPQQWKHVVLSHTLPFNTFYDHQTFIILLITNVERAGQIDGMQNRVQVKGVPPVPQYCKENSLSSEKLDSGPRNLIKTS